MTAPFLLDFIERKRHVRHYLAIVLSAERLTMLGTTTRAQERRLLTLRAGSFLLLYNLIEATTRGAIEAIHDQIATERIPFEMLTIQLRKEMVRRFKQTPDTAVHHTTKDFTCEFVGVALGGGITLAGNVDARYIRNLADIYGFSCRTARDRTWGGSDLLTVKDRRNDLAHGRQTFEEVGRDYPSRELLRITRRSLSFMGEILGNVALYLDDRGYLNEDASKLAPTGRTASKQEAT